jgi:hypothetical protein
VTDDERPGRLAAVEVGAVALVASLLVGLLTLGLAPFAAAFLAVSLWRLGTPRWPDPVPTRTRQAAVAVGIQSALLAAAGIVALTVGRPSAPFTAVNSVAGLVLLVALHLYVDGFRHEFDDGAVGEQWAKSWKALRLLDLFLLIGVALTVVITVANETLDEQRLQVSISLAPAAVMGVGTIYRLGRAHHALRRVLERDDA